MFAAVGVLVAFPLPPRQLDDATSGARAAVPPCSPCPLPAPAADELSVAAQGGSMVAAAWIRRSAGGTTGTVRLLDYRGRPATMRPRVSASTQSDCGAGCVRFAHPGTLAVLSVAVTDRGRTFTVGLPATWSAAGTTRARALLDRAQATMRALHSIRQVEDVTSGPGTFARTTYRLLAPDRLAYTTDRGVQGVTVGARQFVRVPGGTWQESPTAADVPFRTASWFRFTPYATAVRLLGEHTDRRPADRRARADGPGDARVDAADGRRGERARAARRARPSGPPRHAPQRRLRRARFDRRAQGSRSWRLRRRSAPRCAWPGGSPPR